MGNDLKWKENEKLKSIKKDEYVGKYKYYYTKYVGQYI